ncbi:hypothetical protein ADUPG1_006962, partial [Aduncisulcus paluster]
MGLFDKLDHSLTKIRLDDAGISDISVILQELSEFPNLASLYLRGNKITNWKVDMSHLKGLKVLDVTGNPPPRDLQALIVTLQGCPSLESLYIDLASEEDEDDLIVNISKLNFLNGLPLSEGVADIRPSTEPYHNDLAGMPSVTTSDEPGIAELTKSDIPSVTQQSPLSHSSSLAQRESLPPSSGSDQQRLAETMKSEELKIQVERNGWYLAEIERLRARVKMLEMAADKQTASTLGLSSSSKPILSSSNHISIPRSSSASLPAPGLPIHGSVSSHSLHTPTHQQHTQIIAPPKGSMTPMSPGLGSSAHLNRTGTPSTYGTRGVTGKKVLTLRQLKDFITDL